MKKLAASFSVGLGLASLVGIAEASSASAGPYGYYECVKAGNNHFLDSQSEFYTWWGIPYDNVDMGSPECRLAYGDKSEAVTVLQRHLSACNGVSLSIDGVFGPATRDAVIRVQRAGRVTADGIYGPQTASVVKWKMTQISRFGTTAICGIGVGY